MFDRPRYRSSKPAGGSRLGRWIAAIALAACLLAPAAAALTRRDLAEAGFHLKPGTALPAGAVLHATGGDTTLGRALAGKPAFLVFTDYRCESLCGLVLDQLAAALATVPLRLGRDYEVVSVALDPAQTADDAAAFRAAHARGTDVQRQGLFFTEDARSLALLRESVGLVAPFDAEHRQYAHPAGVVLVSAQGKAERILSPFALERRDLLLALSEQGAPASLSTHALLLCYGWDPVSGTYTVQVEQSLAVAGGVTILALALGIALLMRRERRRAEHPSTRPRVPTL